jgi:hypothetical protein
MPFNHDQKTRQNRFRRRRRKRRLQINVSIDSHDDTLKRIKSLPRQTGQVVNDPLVYQFYNGFFF